MPRTAKTTPPTARWIRAGEPVALQGRTYSGGMIYYGQRLAAVTPGNAYLEPSLVDPELYGKAREYQIPGKLQYYPAYHSLTPAARSRYIEWLVAGRRTPEIDAGYVFLFFYGIERRILHDLVNQLDDPEVEQLLHEVRELRQTYSDHRAIVGYTTRFLDFVSAMQGRADPQIPSIEHKGPLPWAVRLKIARLAHAKKHVSANWAWAWAMLSPDQAARDLRERAALKRCPKECKALFGIRYREAFPEGYFVKPASEPLTASYTPASASFGWRGSMGLQVRAPGLTDPAKPEALAPVLRVLSSVINELEPFSRWIGKNPEGRRRAEVITMLPEVLVDAEAHPAVQIMANQAHTLLGSKGYRIIEFGQLIDAFAGAVEMPTTDRQFERFTEVLHRIGYGIEPDPNFGGRKSAPEDQCTIFRRPISSHESGMSSRFAVAALAVRMGALVLQADAPIDKAAIQVLDEQIAGTLKLTAADRARLRARVRLYSQLPPNQVGLAKTLQSAPPERAQTLGQMLIAVAHARGAVRPGSIRMIEKLFDYMGLDKSAIHDDLHDFVTRPAARPAVTVADDVDDENAHEDVIVIEPEPAPEPVHELDEQVIAARMEESQRLSSMLGEIFEEEDAAPAPAPVPSESASNAVTAMLAELQAKSTWPREEFQQLARRYKMPLDGALEQLDDVAWEVAGESLFDGYDPIEINAYALELLTNA